MHGTYGLIVLDVMLPGVDGMTICQRTRQAKPLQPIMMLTAKGDELSRVLGLEFGADDYLVKPFSVPEFRARVKALLRRSLAQAAVAVSAGGSAGGAAAPQVFGDVVIDTVKQKVLFKGAPVVLTALEYDLLAFLAARPGVPLSRATILESVWGYASEAYENNVNTHINRLRNKIESDPANPKLLLTVRGVGYRFADSDELQAL